MMRLGRKRKSRDRACGSSSGIPKSKEIKKNVARSLATPLPYKETDQRCFEKGMRVF
jgi:hypothetical protein